jgi:lipase
LCGWVNERAVKPNVGLTSNQKGQSMFEQTNMQVKGIAVGFSEAGFGAPVVLLHSGGSSSAQWKGYDELLGVRYRIVAPDLFGSSGQTAAWQGPDDLTHGDQANLVGAVMDALGVDAAHLVGHSYGGATALRFALQMPERVRTLTVIEPQVVTLLPQAGEHILWQEYRMPAQRFMDLVQAGEAELAWRESFDFYNGAGSWEGLSERRRARFVSAAGSGVQSIKSTLNNPITLDDCRSIQAPTLIICGGRTTAVQRRVSELLRDAIPKREYAIIAEAGHMSPLTHANEAAVLLSRHFNACVPLVSTPPFAPFWGPPMR